MVRERAPFVSRARETSTTTARTVARVSEMRRAAPARSRAPNRTRSHSSSAASSREVDDGGPWYVEKGPSPNLALPLLGVDAGRRRRRRCARRWPARHPTTAEQLVSQALERRPESARSVARRRSGRLGVATGRGDGVGPIRPSACSTRNSEFRRVRRTCATRSAARLSVAAAGLQPQTRARSSARRPEAMIAPPRPSTSCVSKCRKRCAPPSRHYRSARGARASLRERLSCVRRARRARRRETSYREGRGSSLLELLEAERASVETERGTTSTRLRDGHTPRRSR